MNQATLINQQLLVNLLAEAASSPRQRKNKNFHASDDAACHRLLNALQPETYVQPHCHFSADKEETMVVLIGKMGLILFNDDGSVAMTQVASAGGDCVGINIPPRMFHSLVALEPVVFFEAKAGPYVPVALEERAAWAPSEGDAACAQYREWMRSLFVA